MLPCKRETSEGNNNAHYSLDQSINNRWRFLSADKFRPLSAKVVHVIFCVTTMVLGGARVRQWKDWEDSVRQDITKSDPTSGGNVHVSQRQHHEFFCKRGVGYWRRAAIIGWVEHFPSHSQFDFHKYMMWTLEIDFRKIVGIRMAYLFLVSVFAADYEYCLKNSFEIAFFFWIWTTYGFHSCIMEKLGYIVPRLIMGVLVQVLCSYSTLPLYEIVSQMGTMYKEGIFDQNVQQYIGSWVGGAKGKQDKTDSDQSLSQRIPIDIVISN
ncbi:hypothetical protein DVH24_033064 [Malus domestica]|uniref:MLO-like protein n=1 Tax=Malus domestica TaxID=3750 RepID=A0A498J902_MALDO|nr:hypothetical protein DVH24_033064 [Malus domestica]